MDDNKQSVKKEDYIFGLDIGASKVNLFVGISEGESVRVVECGDFPLESSDEYDSVVETLQKAVHMLESSAGVDVRDVYVGIAGKHVSSFSYKGLVTLPTNEVRDEDIINVQRQASTLPDKAGEIIHIFPGEYTLDDRTGIRNPKGYSGRRLGVEVQVVTSRDERELGVALIDIGAGSADVAVFVKDSVRYTASLDIAGNVITSDISKCLKVPVSLTKAEEIKKKYGTCSLNNLIEDETFPVPGVGDRGEVLCSRKLLAQIITARVAEIFKLLAKDLEKHHLDTVIDGGIVLTGGCCNLAGIEDIAAKVFKKPVHIGKPRGTSGIQEAFQNPSYATGIGLLYYANKKHRERKQRDTDTQLLVTVKKGVQRIRDFIKTYF